LRSAFGQGNLLDLGSQMDELNGQNEAAAGSAAVAFDQSGTPVITLTGEIDISNVDPLRATIEPVVEQAPERVVFDLSGLDFMDSSGIALLLYVAAKAGSVHLRGPSTLVRRILEVSGLSDILHIDS
jgi:anti-sigma B factor antagonist